MGLDDLFKDMTPGQQVLVADLALSRIISLVLKLAEKAGDEETIAELTASADEMDTRRAEAMAPIYARLKNAG